MKKDLTPETNPAPRLLDDIRQMIDEARTHVAAVVNTGLVLLYWRIGRRVDGEILQSERAEYGARIVVTLSRDLQKDYGTGFAEKNLRRMIQFFRAFPNKTIVVTLSRHLSWSHFVSLLPLADSLQRDFYTEMCRVER